MTAPKLVHPVFCGGPDAGCTVIDRDLPYSGTAHRSRPVVLNLSGSADARVFGSTVATVHLEQHRASYETDVFAVLRYRGGELALPVDVAQTLLAEVGKLLARTVPPAGPDNLRAAELATRNGSPASAEDDECPACDWTEGTAWLGESDFGQNHWAHLLGYPPEDERDASPCGLRWTTPVRRPNNGVEFVLVIPAAPDRWETRCLYRGEVEQHPTEAAARAYAAQHTADHEAEESK